MEAPVWKLADVRHVALATFLALGAMLMAAGAGEAMKPSRVLADELPPLDLQTMVPVRFGEWTEVSGASAVVSDPTLDATLAQFYSQTLLRTYENRRGQRVMLSLAYGRNQNSWNTAAHRPEFCYDAQGFTVTGKGVHSLALEGHDIPVVRMVGARGGRHEPVTYWVTLSDSVAVPGLSRKLQQIRYGMQGLIVDGMLVRMSSLGGDDATEFALHHAFARDLEQALPASHRARFFGH